MLVMIACGAALLTAVVLAVRWRGHAFAMPEWSADDTAGLGRGFRSLCWLLGVGALTGLVMGVLVVGPAGRLAMRLLAATSPDAQGRITEADQVVGQITANGTLGFLIFVGLPVGLAVALTYVVASFGLPRGMTGGVVLGAVLLVLFASRLDPLRPENPDFDLVGPGWLSVVTFTAMGLVTGALTAPIAGRVATALPAPTWWWIVWLVPVTLVALAALSFVWQVLPILVAAGALRLAAARVPRLRMLLHRRGRLLLQGGLGAAVLVALPGFLAAMAEIATT